MAQFYFQNKLYPFVQLDLDCLKRKKFCGNDSPSSRLFRSLASLVFRFRYKGDLDWFTVFSFSGFRFGGRKWRLRDLFFVSDFLIPHDLVFAPLFIVVFSRTALFSAGCHVVRRNYARELISHVRIHETLLYVSLHVRCVIRIGYISSRWCYKAGSENRTATVWLFSSLLLNYRLDVLWWIASLQKGFRSENLRMLICLLTSYSVNEITRTGMRC